MDEYEKDLELCDDGQRDRARRACRERAGNRLTNCYTTGSYNRLGRWTFQDATGQPQGDEDPDKRQKKKPGQNLKPQQHPKPDDKPDSSPEVNPRPDGNPDKSEFSWGSFGENFILSNPQLLGLYLANPKVTGPMLDAMLRKIVLMPSDYPEQMRPLSPYSPQPMHYSALGVLPGPFRGAMGLPFGRAAPR